MYGCSCIMMSRPEKVKKKEKENKRITPAFHKAPSKMGSWSLTLVRNSSGST